MSETDYKKTYFELLRELIVLEDKLQYHLLEIHNTEDENTVRPIFCDIHNEIERVREVSMEYEDVDSNHDNEYLKHLRPRSGKISLRCNNKD